MHKISFPGLGIPEFSVNEVAIPNVFGRDIRWYAIIIALGILAACLYVLYRAKKNEGIKTDDVMDYAIWLVLCGIVGARLFYVFTSFDKYKGDGFLDTVKNIVAVWEGGLAIYGGIIAGGIALAVVSLIKKIKLGKAFDMVAPGVMLGQILGRWGNFFNGEAYGWSENVASFPLRMRLEGAYRTVLIGGKEQKLAVDFVHPTFLYESLWNLLGFLIINLFYKKKKFDGQIFFMYITWYGFGRMIIEGLRTDSLPLGDLRISQVIGFLCFFVGATVLTAMAIVGRLRKKDEAYLALSAPAVAEDAAAILPASEEEDTEEEGVKEESAEEENASANETEEPPAESFDIAALHQDDDEDDEA